MEEYDRILQADPSEHIRFNRNLPQSIHQGEMHSDLKTLREDILHEFFGTRLDKEKTIFVISMLSLISAFFVVSAFSVSLDIILGAIIISFAVYAGFRWTRDLLSSET